MFLLPCYEKVHGILLALSVNCLLYCAHYREISFSTFFLYLNMRYCVIGDLSTSF